MKVKSSGIQDGVIHDKYGKRGQLNEFGMPTYSLPLEITDAPNNTVTFAVVIEDKDAYPVSGGFSWVHWLAANITKTELLENESQLSSDFVQGANSWISHQGGLNDRVECSFYGGMAPPDAPHTYEIHVFALDSFMNLESGFFMNELYREMEGHILDTFTLKGVYAH